jgi:hypothetical protein
MATTEQTKELFDSLLKAVNSLTINNKKEVKTPIFKASKGEDPTIHILKCEDYFIEIRGPGTIIRKEAEFKHTLDNEAREWYNEYYTDGTTTWNQLQTEFLKEFSLQGNNSKALKKSWIALSFNPREITITKFIRKLRSISKQLALGDEQILDALRDAVPREAKLSLIPIDNLPAAINMLKLIYKEDEELVQDSQQSSSASAAPFSILKSKRQNVSFNQSTDIADSLKELTEVMYSYQTQNSQSKPRNNSSKRPYKPWINGNRKFSSNNQTQNFRGNNRRGSSQFNRNFRDRNQNQRDFRFKPYNQDQYRSNNFSRPNFRGRGMQRNFNGQNQPRNFQGTRPQNNFQRPRFDRSPSKGKQFNKQKPPQKDEGRCFQCREFGHWSRECPQLKSQNSSRNHSRNSSFSQLSEIDLGAALNKLTDEISLRNNDSLNN